MKTKGVVQIIPVLVIFLGILVLGLLYWKVKQNSMILSRYRQSYSQGSKSVTEIKSDKDLSEAVKVLDDQTTTQMDADLKALETEISGF